MHKYLVKTNYYSLLYFVKIGTKIRFGFDFNVWMKGRVVLFGKQNHRGIILWKTEPQGNH